MAFNREKFLLNNVLGFVNMGSVFSFLSRKKNRRGLPFFIFNEKEYTYQETYDQARKYADFFLYYKQKRVDAGKMKADEQLAVGVYMDNSPDYVFAFFGAAMTGSAIIAINTGFRGETLSRVCNRAEIGLMITDAGGLEEVERNLSDIEAIGKDDVFIAGGEGKAPEGYKSMSEALATPEVKKGYALPKKVDNFAVLIVIYTSGTTGEPKGVPCTHAKLLGAAGLTWSRLRLGFDDRGHISMPMFHSNAWFIGILPIMIGGASFVLKTKFSASAFTEDALKYGVTYLNYVGQPIHYILVALEKKYGSEEEIIKAVANHPNNRFRVAHGNGATAVDRKKLIRYFNMDHVYELYGSTEAAINTVIMPGDPIDSVGRLTNKNVVILNDRDEPCPPGECDEKGCLLNYDEAVGEICKKTRQDNIIFDGYFKNDEASNKKFRDGYFHSGDLGHVRVINGKKYLYFDGRTDDWIRKDGENFSAENVLNYMLDMPGVDLAAAYGAPCEVADEKVMVALQLGEGQTFDPQKAYDWLMEQQSNGGMDPKWMPDYFRIVDSFEMTHQTLKILSKKLKRQHFNVDKFPDMVVFHRRRGDATYLPLDSKAFEEVKKEFEKMGRENLLYVGL